MATKRKSELKQDALVERLSSGPEEIGPFTVLSGYLGKSGREDRWRLYLNATFDSYVEFNAEDVHHSEPLSTDEAVLGGSRLWLKQGAVVQHIVVSSRTVQAEFLSGQIAATYLAGAQPTGSAQQNALVRCMTMGNRCPADSVDICRTEPFETTFNQHVPACRSDGLGRCGPHVSFGCPPSDFGPFCNTGAFVCGKSAGCTFGKECGQVKTQVLCTINC